MYKMTLCYDGTNYHGWQRQKNGITVQETVENALFSVTGEKITVHGCSRTDAGVHAKEFVCSFESSMTVPEDKVPYALNAVLPDDISIISCSSVPDDFHARFSAVGKEYIYLIHNSPHKNPFLRNSAYHYPYNIDFEAMCHAASFMKGRRDYSAFCASGATVKGFVRNLEFVRLSKEGELITLTTQGDGYLYNMVRIIVGTLLYAGCGKIDPLSVDKIINSRDRRLAGFTVPARGLYLNRVFY